MTNSMKNKRIPLFYKLLLTYILCSTIPLVIIGGLVYGMSINFLNRTISNQTYTSVEAFHNNIDLTIETYETIIERIQSSSVISDALTQKTGVTDTNALYEIMYEVMAEQNIKPIIHIMDLTGELTYSTSEDSDVYKAALTNNWGIFRNMNNQSDRVVIYLQETSYTTGKKSVLSLGGKIYDGQANHIGYALIDMPKEVLLEELRALNSGLSLQIVILDDYGYTLLDTVNPGMEGMFQGTKYLDSKKMSNHKPISDAIKKDSFLVIDYSDEVLGTRTLVNVSSTVFSAFNHILVLIMVIGGVISLSVSGLLAFAQARSISKPISELISLMGEVEAGSFNVKANLGSNDEIGDLGKYFNRMIHRLDVYMNRFIEKQKQLRTTEIKMLQAQIKPHFIYNTLDVIKWSVKLDRKDETISVVTNLAKLLRYSIDNDDEYTTVRRNMEFINSYLAIQRIKYNNTFKVENNIDEGLMDYTMPRLMLQPFIENSIIHGFGKTNINDGVININGIIEDDKVIFQIIDNGVGMTEQEIQEISCSQPDQHIGVYNVNQRIKMYFGDSYGVRIMSNKSEGTSVIITLPGLHEGEIL